MQELANLSGWQRKVMEQVSPILQKFATKHSATVRVENNEINCRIFSSGMVTVQAIVRGKSDECKLDITGIKRSGMETKRTVLLLKEPDYKVDIQEVEKALDTALYG